MSGHVWRWTPAKLERALAFLPDFETFKAASFYPAAAHAGENYSSGPGLCRALLAAGRITYTRQREISRIRTYRKVFRMKYQVTYNDGDTVDVNADTEAGARAHAEQLEQQEFDRAKALDPPMKYTKRTVREVELIKAGQAGPGAEPAKGKSKK